MSGLQPKLLKLATLEVNVALKDSRLADAVIVERSLETVDGMMVIAETSDTVVIEGKETETEARSDDAATLEDPRDASDCENEGRVIADEAAF